MRRPSLIALGLLVAACGKRGGGTVFDRDAQAVVMVDKGGTPQAPLTVEAEPNNDSTKAQVIPVPGGVKATIDDDKDKDFFALQVAQPGTLAVRISGADDADLVVDVLDGSGKRLLTSDNGPAGTVEGFPNLAVQPGAYRVVVKEVSRKTKGGKPRTAPSQPYELSAQLGPAPAPGEELEMNDETAAAQEVQMGATVTGFVGWRKDRDVWKVPLAKAGADDALSVDVDGVPEVALRVSVLDAAEVVLVERQGRAGEPVALRNVALKEKEPHYFVTVTAQKANVDQRYTLRVSSAPFELDEEAEPNDKPAQASPLADVPGADSGTRVGFLGRGDVDVYKLDPAPNPRSLKITVEPPSEVDVTLAIVDQSGGAVGAPIEQAKRGKPETLPAFAVAPNAPVFIKVSARSGASDTERYRLRWSAPVAEAPTPVPGIEE